MVNRLVRSSLAIATTCLSLGVLVVSTSARAMAGSPPANDECASALVLPSAGPFPTTGTEQTSLATSNPADPIPSCGSGHAHSVWFQWTAGGDCDATFETCGSGYDTVVSVYTGTCGSLSEIACVDDGGGPNCIGTTSSSVSFFATSGTLYTFEVTQANGGPGGTLHWSLDWTRPDVTCRRGNLNSRVGPIADVLFINGSRGTDPDRIVQVQPDTPITMSIQRSPSGGDRYVVYGWVGRPFDFTVNRLPRGVGTTCMPTPLDRPRTPQPVKIANTFGFPGQLGVDDWPGPTSQPAPHTLLTVHRGLQRVGFFFLQGIERDRNAPNGRAGVTNGILLISGFPPSR